jgi:MoaA/NifB/PqqE/SkfB family radical SAM enzyme
MKSCVVKLMKHCNNHCRICMVADQINQKGYPDKKTMKMMISRLDRGDMIDFFGGEPTLYPHLIPAIRYASARGVYTKLATNCRTLSNEAYLKKMLQAGLKDIRTSIHGPDAEMHDYLTCAKGSFDQTINGMRNVIKNGITLQVNIVITALNVKRLKETVDMISSLGVKRVKFSNLYIYGNLLSNQDLIPQIEIVAPLIDEAIGYAESKMMEVEIEKTPLCIIPKHQDKAIKEKKQGYIDGRISPVECSGCLVEESCGWVSENYPYNLGWIKPITGNGD